MDRDIKKVTGYIQENRKRRREQREQFSEGQSVVINDPSSDDIGKEGKIVNVNESRSASLDVKLESGEVVSLSPELLDSDDDESDVSFDDVLNDFQDALT